MNPNKSEMLYLPDGALPDLVSEALKNLPLCTESDENLLQRLASAVPPIRKGNQRFYRLDLVTAFFDNLSKALENKDSDLLHKARGRKFKPVDVQEFVESSEYMAQGDHIWPKNMEALWELFHGVNEDGTPRQYVEGVFGGSIGRGKNYTAEMAFSYMLYDLSSFYSPQLDYGLAPGSSIVFVMQSRSLALARKVVFDQFAARLKLSPYFRKNFMFDADVKAELRFPHNIYVYPVGGNETSAFGMNVYGALLDELAFMLRTKDSVQLQFTNEAEYDQAQRLYTHISRRIVTRFRNQGSVPGKLLLISSANHPDDFISRKIKEAETNPLIFVSTGSLWDFIPASRLSSNETFLVDVGTETNQARIVTERNLARGEVLVVPVDYLEDFQRDIDGALRDLAGRPTGAQSPFFPSRDLISSAIEGFEAAYENSLFLQQEILLGDRIHEDDIPTRWDEVINHEYVQDADASLVRACHVDVGLTEDALGLCVGHIGGYRTISSGHVFNVVQNRFEEVQNIEAPAFVIDGFLRVRSQRGTQVDLNQVSNLLLYIHNHVPVRWFSADAFQSASLISAMRGAHIRAGTLSMDTTTAPYVELRNAYYDRRIIHPAHAVLFQELVGLTRRVEGNRVKIDHNADGCFTGDTRIALLDGTNPTFKELWERYPNGEKFPVFSMSADGIVVGWAHHPRITHNRAELLEITLDNHQVIRCTPNHLFMGIDQSWISAKDLLPGDSVMPLYRRTSMIGGWGGYDRVYDPVKDKVRLVHRIVTGDPPRGFVTHHKDRNKRNNHPDNLRVWSKKEHVSYHSKELHKCRDYVAKLRERHKKYRLSGGNEKSRENILRLFDEGLLKTGKSECAVIRCTEAADAKGLCGRHYQEWRRQELRSRAGRIKVAISGNGSKNHQVIAIRPLAYRRSVWDLTVDDYHNFALTAGVFVHNSKDVADALAGVVYLLVTREGRHAARSMGRMRQRTAERVAQEQKSQKKRRSGSVAAESNRKAPQRMIRVKRRRRG